MFNSKKILLFITCCFAAAFSVAQQIKNENGGDGYRAINWTIKDGLSSNAMHAMIKDSKGFMWCSELSEILKYLPPTASARYSYSFSGSITMTSVSNISVLRISSFVIYDFPDPDLPNTTSFAFSKEKRSKITKLEL